MNKKISIAILLFGIMVSGGVLFSSQPKADSFEKESGERETEWEAREVSLKDRIEYLKKENETLRQNPCAGEYDNFFGLRHEASGRVVVVNNCGVASVYTFTENNEMKEVFKMNRGKFSSGSVKFSPLGNYLTISGGTPNTDAVAVYLVNLRNQEWRDTSVIVGGWGFGEAIWAPDDSYRVVVTYNEPYGNDGLQLIAMDNPENPIVIFSHPYVPNIGEELEAVDAKSIQTTPTKVLFSVNIYAKNYDYPREYLRTDSYEYDVRTRSLKKL